MTEYRDFFHTMVMKQSRKILIIVLISLSLTLLIAGSILVSSLTSDAKLEPNKLPSSYAEYTFFDVNDKKMDVGNYVAFEEISENIKHAFIAIEDKRFYKHNGFDVKRLGAAMVVNLKERRFAQGGSTIENQLIKNTHLTSEKTIKRKIKEAKLTLELERRFTKDQILEMYLNVVYFGKGLYGIKNASKAIFGKHPSEIDALEAASLAATVASPSKYSILYNPANNESRTRLVLSLMHNQGYLSDDEWQAANSCSIITNYAKSENNYNEIYNNSMLFELSQMMYKDLICSNKGKIQVYTHFDPEAQISTQNALLACDSPCDNRGASADKQMILADNKSGGIIAYASSNPNAYSQKRQPGSLLKPFIYASAIEEGIILPDTPFFDEKKNHQGYSPANYKNLYYGWIDARDALSKSINSFPVALLDQIGVDNGYSILKNCGISLCDKDKTLALALGGTTYGSTLMELCEGYCTFANGGLHKKLSFIREIRDENGKTLYKNTSKPTRAIDRQASFLTTDMMKTAAKTGTAKQLSYLPYDIAAKTGTVARKEGNSDVWCAAFTERNTVICRYSTPNNDGYLPNSVTGGNQPTKCVRSLFQSIYSAHFPAKMVPPPFMQKVKIDKTIKEELHKLVRFNEHSLGESEDIYVTNNYRFETVDAQAFLIGNLKISATNGCNELSFAEHKDVTYRVLFNGSTCPYVKGVYLIEKQRFPIGKLEIRCFKGDRILFECKKLVRLP